MTGKAFYVLLVVALFSYDGFTQGRPGSQSIAPKGVKIQGSFGFPFKARVTQIIDGCTVKLEIAEDRSGEIDGQKVEIPSNVPEYKGTKLLRLVNTKCSFVDNAVADKSKEALAQLTENEFVEIVFRNWDQIKGSEMIGRLTVLETGTDASLAQLKSGMAKFRRDRRQTLNDSDWRRYKEAERKSKRQAIGLWDK